MKNSVDREEEYYEPRPLPWAEMAAALKAKSRWVVLVAAVGAGVGLAAALVFPKYEANGFYYTPGWGLSDYKRFRSEFGSADVLDAYIKELAPKDDAAAKLLSARAKEPKFWETAVKPLYPITKKDAKELFESTKDKESLSIIGLDLAVEGKNPTAARDAVLLLGDYVTQTLQLTTLQNWAVSNQASSNAEFLKAESDALRMRYSMDQTRQRIADLRALKIKYPESQNIASRQVVTVDAQSARFLPPLAQVIALEAGLAESNEALRRIDRRVAQLKLEADFFNRAAGVAKSTRQGAVLLATFEEAKQEAFKPHNSDDERVKEVSNRFDLDIKGFRDQFTIGFGFRSPVLEPSQSARSPTRFAVVGGILSLILSLFVVLVPVVIRGLRDSTTPSRLA